MTITSVNNDKIKSVCKLKEKKYRDKTNIFFVEGIDLINEAYKNDCLDELYVLEGEDVPFDIKYTFVNYEVMKKMSDMDSISPYLGICHKANERQLDDKIIILDGIQDPGNLGTIIRSGIAFGFNTFVLSETTVDLYNPKTIRSTKGMIFNSNVLVKNLCEFIPTLNEYIIYGTDVKYGIDIKKETFDKKIAIVIGNEGKGISQEVKTLCNKFIYLKMDNNCESLNAAVATSIIMYEVYNK